MKIASPDQPRPVPRPNPPKRPRSAFAVWAVRLSLLLFGWSFIDVMFGLPAASRADRALLLASTGQGVQRALGSLACEDGSTGRFDGARPYRNSFLLSSPSFSQGWPIVHPRRRCDDARMANLAAHILFVALPDDKTVFILEIGVPSQPLADSTGQGRSTTIIPDSLVLSKRDAVAYLQAQSSHPADMLPWAMLGAACLALSLLAARAQRLASDDEAPSDPHTHPSSDALSGHASASTPKTGASDKAGADKTGEASPWIMGPAFAMMASLLIFYLPVGRETSRMSTEILALMDDPANARRIEGSTFCADDPEGTFDPKASPNSKRPNLLWIKTTGLPRGVEARHPRIACSEPTLAGRIATLTVVASKEFDVAYVVQAESNGKILFGPEAARKDLRNSEGLGIIYFLIFLSLAGVASCLARAYRFLTREAPPA